MQRDYTVVWFLGLGVEKTWVRKKATLCCWGHHAIGSQQERESKTNEHVKPQLFSLVFRLCLLKRALWKISTPKTGTGHRMRWCARLYFHETGPRGLFTRVLSISALAVVTLFTSLRRVAHLKKETSSLNGEGAFTWCTIPETVGDGRMSYRLSLTLYWSLRRTSLFRRIREYVHLIVQPNLVISFSFSWSSMPLSVRVLIHFLK